MERRCVGVRACPATVEFETQLYGAIIMICSACVLRSCCSFAQSISVSVAAESFVFGRPSIVIEGHRLCMGCLHVANIGRSSLQQLPLVQSMLFAL